MRKGHELWYRVNKISVPNLGVDEEWRVDEDHPSIHTISLHISPSSPLVIRSIEWVTNHMYVCMC